MQFSKKNIQLKYQPRISGKETIHSFIIALDKEDIGFIQYYSLEDYLPDGLSDYHHPLFNKYTQSELAGIDLFIGEEKYLHQGYGAKIITQFLKEIIFPHFKAVIVDPELKNTRAIRAYQKTGFVNFSQEVSEQTHEEVQLMLLDKNPPR